jgi:pilus assembly protein CpaE
LSRHGADLPGRNEILVVTRDAETERAVALAAEGDGQISGHVIACRDLATLGRELGERPRTRLVLVDVDPEPLAMLAGLESIMRRHGQPRYLVICSELDNQLVLEAMQIGARHCLVKATLQSDLVPVLRRLLEGIDAGGGHAPRASGQVITVMTASGGAGGTTLAINLADELRTSSGRASLLVDLDLHYGAMAAYLGLNPEYGVADLLNTRGTIDAQLVRSTAAAHLDDLHVLTSPASLDRPGGGVERFDKLESVLAVCREAYAHTVIDAPRAPREVAARLVMASDLTLIVFQLSVVDVRSTRAILRALTDRGASPERILPVANRWVKRSRMLSLEDAREALGGLEVAQVGNDFDNVMRSINYGQPLSRVAPRSPVRADLGRLARRAAALAASEEVGR